MIKTFTPNDVILYVYNELPETETGAIERAILTDASLAEVFYETSIVRNSLHSLLRSPSEKTVNRILEYSRNF